MRAADLVKSIWGAPPLATVATSATRASPSVKPSQLSQGVQQGNYCLPVATVAGMDPAQNEAAQTLPELLAQHGGFPGIDWQGLVLIDAQASALWIVQRPDGLLTTLATVEPISKPLSYRQAWPARFTTPEPDDPAPAAKITQAVIKKIRQDCRGSASK
jgi:hypothetical protein